MLTMSSPSSMAGGPGSSPGGNSNPRKFSEKIHIIRMKELEEKSEFDKIFKDIEAMKSQAGQPPPTYRPHQLTPRNHHPSTLHGSLPNVNTQIHSPMSNAGTQQFQGVTGQYNHVEGRMQRGTPVTISTRESPINMGGNVSVIDSTMEHRGRSSLSSSPHGGTNGISSSPGPTKRHKNRIDTSPYKGGSYRCSTESSGGYHNQRLSPPADSLVRRVHSDTSIHQSVLLDSYIGAGMTPTLLQQRGTSPIPVRSHNSGYRRPTTEEQYYPNTVSQPTILQQNHDSNKQLRPTVHSGCGYVPSGSPGQLSPDQRERPNPINNGIGGGMGNGAIAASGGTITSFTGNPGTKLGSLPDLTSINTNGNTAVNKSHNNIANPSTSSFSPINNQPPMNKHPSMASSFAQTSHNLQQQLQMSSNVQQNVDIDNDPTDFFQNELDRQKEPVKLSANDVSLLLSLPEAHVLDCDKNPTDCDSSKPSLLDYRSPQSPSFGVQSVGLRSTSPTDMIGSPQSPNPTQGPCPGSSMNSGGDSFKASVPDFSPAHLDLSKEFQRFTIEKGHCGSVQACPTPGMFYPSPSNFQHQPLSFDSVPFGCSDSASNTSQQTLQSGQVQSPNPQTPSSIPDIILTDADDLVMDQTLQKVYFVGLENESIMKNDGMRDSDFDKMDELGKLDELGLRLLEDNLDHNITDPATEEHLKL